MVLKPDIFLFLSLHVGGRSTSWTCFSQHLLVILWKHLYQHLQRCHTGNFYVVSVKMRWNAFYLCVYLITICLWGSFTHLLSLLCVVHGHRCWHREIILTCCVLSLSILLRLFQTLKWNLRLRSMCCENRTYLGLIFFWYCVFPQTLKCSLFFIKATVPSNILTFVTRPHVCPKLVWRFCHETHHCVGRSQSVFHDVVYSCSMTWSLSLLKLALCKSTTSSLLPSSDSMRYIRVTYTHFDNAFIALFVFPGADTPPYLSFLAIRNPTAPVRATTVGTPNSSALSWKEHQPSAPEPARPRALSPGGRSALILNSTLEARRVMGLRGQLTCY